MSLTTIMKSTFRTGYIIQSITIVTVLLIPILILGSDDGSSSLANQNRYLFSFIGFIWIFGGLYLIVQRSLFIIELTENEIIISRFFKPKTTYTFNEIIKLESRSATSKRRFYSSPGFQIFTIHFYSGDRYDISENTFSNFHELINLIIDRVEHKKL